MYAYLVCLKGLLILELPGFRTTVAAALIAAMDCFHVGVCEESVGGAVAIALVFPLTC